MPQSHQSSQQTKSKSRGSISPLIIIWIVVTFAGASAITRATSTVHRRAVVQTMADAIALAAASHGDVAARQFAQSQDVHVLSLSSSNQYVSVRIRMGNTIASATAFDPL